MKNLALSLALAATCLFAAACGGDVEDVDPTATAGFSCPTGQKFENNKCVDATVDAGNACPAGQHLESAKCVDDSSSPTGSITVRITGLQSVEQFKYEVASSPSDLGRTFTGGGSNLRNGNEITISIPYTGSAAPYLRFSCWTGTTWCATDYSSPDLNISGNATWNGVTKSFEAISVRPNNAEVLVKFGTGAPSLPLQTH